MSIGDIASLSILINFAPKLLASCVSPVDLSFFILVVIDIEEMCSHMDAFM